MYSQLVCPVVSILGLKNEWTSIDYSGYERVNFAQMKYTYHDSQSNPDEHVRDIRRVEGVWMITDDHDNWVEYCQGCGEGELLEEWYQSWIKGE